MLYETKFLLSLGTTLAIEVPLVTVFAKSVFKVKNKKVLFVAFLASLLTLPYLWFILPPYVDARYYLYIGEGLVVLIEALIFYRLLELKIWKAFLISLVANVTSYWLGIWVLRVLL